MEALVKEADPQAEVYLIGSVAEGRHVFSSDIDVLVLTEKKADEILKKLWEAGVEDPFQIHVKTPEAFREWREKVVAIKVSEFLRK